MSSKCVILASAEIRVLFQNERTLFPSSVARLVSMFSCINLVSELSNCLSTHSNAQNSFIEPVGVSIKQKSVYFITLSTRLLVSKLK